MAHENSPELCSRSRPVPQIMIVVFPAFTQSLSLYTFHGSQQSMDIFFHGVCNNDTVIYIKAPKVPQSIVITCLTILYAILSMTFIAVPTIQSFISALVQSINYVLVEADSWNLPIYCDKASSMMLKSCGLSKADPWCTPTFS